MQYLRQYNPALYMQAVRVEQYKRLTETEEQAKERKDRHKGAADAKGITYEFGEQSYQVAYVTEETPEVLFNSLS